MKQILIFILMLWPLQILAQHQAILNYQSSSCTSTSPCNIQIYRSPCQPGMGCPIYGQPSHGAKWTRLPLPSTTVVATPTATGTTWVVTDKDPNLQDNTGYTYVAMLAWTGTAVYSQPGPAWSGATSGPVAGTPQVPTIGTGNSVH